MPEPRYEDACARLTALLEAGMRGSRPFGAAYENPPRVERQWRDPKEVVYFPSLFLMANSADEEKGVSAGNEMVGTWRLRLSLVGLIRGDGTILPITWAFRLAEDALRTLQINATLNGSVRDVDQVGRVEFHEFPTDAGHVAGFERGLTVIIDEPIAVD